MGKNDFCCAYGCNHDRGKGVSCHFYEFPLEREWRDRWISAIRRDVRDHSTGKVQPWVPSESDNSKLCSCHFEVPPDPKSRRPDARHVVPTIFVYKKFRTPRLTVKSTRSRRSSPSPHPRRKRAKLFADATQECSTSSTDYGPNPAEVTPDQNNTTVSMDTQECSTDSGPNPAEVTPDQNNTTRINLDHDYVKTSRAGRLADAMDSLVEEHPEVSEFLKDYDTAKAKAEMFDKMTEKGQILTLENVKHDDKLFLYYTGFPSYAVFKALFEYLKDKASDMKYAKGSKTEKHKHFSHRFKSKPGKKRVLTHEDEFFITLVRLRLGLPSKDCAKRFGLAESTYSNIFRTWTALLSVELSALCELPPVDNIITTKAECFSEFGNIAIIIDCTELFSETPSALSAHKQMYSNYKHHSTVKFLVGISPAGAVTYISQMYGGRASDKQITQESDNLLASLYPGTGVMADRGFLIHDDLPPGVTLVIPSFKPKNKAQFTKKEVMHSKKIAEARVHVERAMRRIKQFRLLEQGVRLAMINNYENIFKTCGYLVNFQDPFLKV